MEADAGGTSYGRFQNASGASQYLQVAHNDTGVDRDGKWEFFSSVGSDEAEVLMTSTTAAILKSGSIDSSGLITYSGSTYRIRLKFSTFGSGTKKPIAEAYVTGS